MKTTLSIDRKNASAISSIKYALSEFGIQMTEDETNSTTNDISFILDNDGEESVKQSIENGTQVIFENKGFSYEEWGDEDISKEEFEYINGKQATVLYLETHSKLGTKDGEYYTIKFDMEDGTKLGLVAVSGYHLTIVK